MADKKMLVIAGTHRREYDFSHPVADLIVEMHGGSLSRPHDRIEGGDGARRAELWGFGKMGIVKIHDTGKGDDHAEEYGNRPQWTSVHERVLEDAGESVAILDLHSWNEATGGMEGKTLYMMPRGDPSYNDEVAVALDNAREREPGLYGNNGKTGFTMPKFPYITKLTYMPEDRLARILKNIFKDEKISIEEIRKNDDMMKRVILGYGRREAQELYSGENDRWFFVNRKTAKEARPGDYLFEAVHWQKNQREATARFISEYLAPLII